jgi:CDP-diacylglycerol pyrophosphatase
LPAPRDIDATDIDRLRFGPARDLDAIPPPRSDHPETRDMVNAIRRWPRLPLIIGAALGLIISPALAADPSALWKITDKKCVPDMRDHDNPAPCSVVDLSGGYVVLKDLIGATQFLLIPTKRIGGMESPEILSPDAVNYWDPAWRNRRLTEERAGKSLPRDALSLAVNSFYGRTQDQLHIHIDCVRPDVRDALAANRGAIGKTWTAFPVSLADLPWRALRVDGDDLANANPFDLLAKGDPGAAADMSKHTLAVVGITWSDNIAGFAVLDGKFDVPPGNPASAEVLQDHDCALAH